ncbi:hypothetical protein DQ04_00711100 [Trypanosoma grayi]|uniref:hypothetical protein n=1 Tax=Trypanosoma grayi TaxID=71804 RepID=UPI0004F45792|nr:hypothetical protein DQ04_00711100 [Trypanosoma grayi]KEG13932.1 hypothetical protein DQ04_00711100 [Trypanosoma grayi]
MPLNVISVIYVHSIDPMQKRRFVSFVSKVKDVDICVETVGKDGDVMLKHVHTVLCTNSSENTLPIRSVGAKEGSMLRLQPKGSYRMLAV